MALRLAVPTVLLTLVTIGCVETHAPLTQLVIQVVPNASASALDVEITTPTGERHHAMTAWRAGDPTPSAGLAWVSGPLEPVRVRASTTGSGGSAEAQVITGFVAGESRVVTLVLSDTCVGVRCADDTTCVAGACVDASVPASSLPTWTGTLPELDGGALDGGGLPGDRDAFVAPGTDAGIDAFVQPTDAGVDSQVPDASPCTCATVGDECISGRCYGASCDVLHPCGMGYACDSSSRCVCTDTTICGAHCVADTSCAIDQRCIGGTCVPRVNECYPPFGCDPGQQCRLDAADYLTCVAPSGASTGSSCTQDDQCFSNVCYMGVCLDPCDSNADCGSVQVCVASASSSAGGCVPEASSTCMACLGGGSLCVEGHCATACRSNADCDPMAACTDRRMMGTVLLLECIPIPRACGPEDVELSAPGGTTCVRGFCATGMDCPTGYVCDTFVSLGLWSELPLASAYGLCRRAM
jgi:hypothetical protein